MGNGLRAVWRGLGNFRNLGYAYIWANLAFVALSLPLITLPAAYSALQRVGHLAHTDPSEANLSAFWETVRRRPLSVRARVVANSIGVLVLLSLMGMAIMNDVVRLLQ